jgi:hydroxymethylglutaryl-CoA synthase
MIKMVGIIAYQGYVPKYRITSKEIHKVWGLSASIIEKSVPYNDEDTISLGVAASLDLFSNLELDVRLIDAIYFASVSSPYIDKPVSTTLVSVFGLRNDVLTTDFGGSAQAGLMALMNMNNLLKEANLGLLVVSDCLKSEPRSILERSFGSGSVALLLGNKNTIADLTGHSSYSIEISDRWKGVDSNYKVGDERFTREYGYIPAISKAITGLLEKKDKEINEYDHVIIQQLDGKIANYISKELKFDRKKLEKGTIVNNFGDLGSVTVFMGLAKVLDTAEENEEILLAAYSSGGCHAMTLKTNPNIKNFQANPKTIDLINNKENIDYITYLKYLGYI